mmetsp:Transcript_52829/g.150616  ORF Transcript_52829/g.150616 Transcript_52829/m.150616 type:complete len:200 (+) Transcript_52829:979-1578(+)
MAAVAASSTICPAAEQRWMWDATPCTAMPAQAPMARSFATRTACLVLNTSSFVFLPMARSVPSSIKCEDRTVAAPPPAAMPSCVQAQDVAAIAPAHAPPIAPPTAPAAAPMPTCFKYSLLLCSGSCHCETQPLTPAVSITDPAIDRPRPTPAVGAAQNKPPMMQPMPPATSDTFAIQRHHWRCTSQPVSSPLLSRNARS